MKGWAKSFAAGAIFASLFVSFFDQTMSSFSTVLALLSISHAILYLADRRKE